MKSYEFEVGEENTRVYKGNCVPPMAGMNLGLRVAKIVSGSLSELDIEGSLTEMAGDNRAIAKAIIKALPALDTESLQSIFLEIIKLGRLDVYLKDDKRVEHKLNSELDINKWFEEYRQDLIIVSTQVISRNCAPFFPGEFKSMIGLNA